MNSLTPHVINDDERFTIASYAPINAFVPTEEDTQYVSDHTGNYWPFRSLDFQYARDNLTAAERTSNRTVSLRLVDNRAPHETFPQPLWETAREIFADQVLPNWHVTSRSDMACPSFIYENHDPTEDADILTPAPQPHGMTLGTVSESLTKPNLNTSDPLGSTPHVSDIAIRDLSRNYGEGGDLLETVELAIDSTTGDVNIHLHEPIINSELVSVIREYPSVIGSVSIPPSATDYIDVPEAETSSFLSGAGSRDLSNTPCPYVRIAAELSLLTSSFIDDEKLPVALEASVIPRVDTDISVDIPTISPTEHASQETLDSLLS